MTSDEDKENSPCKAKKSRKSDTPTRAPKVNSNSIAAAFMKQSQNKASTPVAAKTKKEEIDTPASGKKTTPASGKKTTPASGKKTTPASGKKTTPASGKKTTPAGGKKTTTVKAELKYEDSADEVVVLKIHHIGYLEVVLVIVVVVVLFYISFPSIIETTIIQILLDYI